MLDQRRPWVYFYTDLHVIVAGGKDISYLGITDSYCPPPHNVDLDGIYTVWSQLPFEVLYFEENSYHSKIFFTTTYLGSYYRQYFVSFWYKEQMSLLIKKKLVPFLSPFSLKNNKE